MLEGYRGELRKVLEKNNIEINDTIQVIDDDFIYEGILMPRYEIFDPNYLTIKLKNGYNIGIKYNPELKIKLISKFEKTKKIEFEEEEKIDSNKFTITYIGTGGTIMSRIDYKTGAVKPSFNLEDLLDVIPEAKHISNIKMLELFKIFSEDITPKHWSLLAQKIYEEFNSNSKGIIIAHGTDTLGYSSAALSFSLQNLPHPVIFVGAQRSLDRPSSDAALNLHSAFNFAINSNYSGIFVIMHGDTSDEYCLVHKGTRVRKLHTSARYAFKSINSNPVAKIYNKKIVYENIESLLKRDDSRKIKLFNKFEEKVFILKAFPSIKGEVINYLVDKGYKGILIEGTGLGHTPISLLEGIKYAINKGVLVVISSQCIWGRVNMYVYERGRELLKLGVIGTEDMFPETAFVKLMWALGNSKNTEEAKKLFLTNIAGEISQRSLYY